MTKPTAHISVDLDTVDTHLAGYGFKLPPCDRIYRTSVPRILDLLDRVGMRTTLFVIARDAESEATLWREALRRGHEIASHSVTHPIPFAALPAEDIARELRESRDRLAQVIGKPVLGFRAPGWDVDRATLEAIGAAGYRYDASVLPSPALLAGMALRFFLSAGRMPVSSLSRSLVTAFWRRCPHRLGSNGGLWEFPITVSPWLRVPFTHTLWHLAPHALCRRTYRAIRRSGATLCYQFHAVDLLDLDLDSVDTRMARHPGMRVPLDRKATLLEQFLRELAGTYEVIPYTDALARLAAGAT